MTEAAGAPVEVYGTFSGTIDQLALNRIFSTGAFVTNAIPRIGRVHLLFQTSGGLVADGVCLYNYFRTFPAPLTLYNAGSVQSIGTIAFLGAAQRKTSARATFMLHRTRASPQFAQAEALQQFADGVALDDRRTEAILRHHVALTSAQWAQLDRGDLQFSSEEALRIGLASEIGDFAPPAGTGVFNI